MSMFKVNAVENDQWFRTSLPCRGAALVLHGLNLRSSAMSSLSSILVELGFDVLQLTLVSPWKNHVMKAWEQIQARASDVSGKRIFLAYSTGATLGLDVLSECAWPPDETILFAPAIALRRHAQLIRPMCYLPGRFCLPSLASPLYRQRPWTPISEYRMLLHHMDRLSLNRIPFEGLILLDPRDELISPDATRLFFNIPHRWKYEAIHAIPSRFHHLIIDEASLGETEWKRVTSLIREHLNRKDIRHAFN